MNIILQRLWNLYPLLIENWQLSYTSLLKLLLYLSVIGEEEDEDDGNGDQLLNVGCENHSLDGK